MCWFWSSLNLKSDKLQLKIKQSLLSCYQVTVEKLKEICRFYQLELDKHLDLYNCILSVGAKKPVVTRLGNVQSDQRRADTDRKSEI